MMVLEGVVGGPMDCWSDVTTPQDQLECSLEILREYFPHESENFAGASLTDGHPLGRITPTVRSRWVLANGGMVFGVGDAVV
jgi:hypothetical protein